MADGCRRIEPLLSACLDAELDAHEQVAVEEHLATCPSCADELERLRVTRTMMRSLPVRLMPHELVAPVLDGDPFRRKAAREWARAAGVATVTAALLGAAAFAAGGPDPQPRRLVQVPVETFVADHLRHGAGAPPFIPVVSGTR